MTGEVIKSFLVGLGFHVDANSLAKFNKAIVVASAEVAALGAAVVATAGFVAKGISGVSEDFEELGYNLRLIYPAVNKAIILRKALLDAYAAAGVNLKQTVINAYKLNLSLTKTKFLFEALYKSVASRFFTAFTKQSDLLRKRILANMPKIQAVLESVVKYLFVAFDAVIRIGGRVWAILAGIYAFFVKLSPQVKLFLGALALFLSPLALITAIIASLLLLYDDYKTFMEGGKSFIDWNKYIPIIEAVKKSVLEVWEAVKQVYYAFQDLGKADEAGFWKHLEKAGEKVLPVLRQLWEVIKKEIVIGVTAIGDFLESRLAAALLSAFKHAVLKVSPAYIVGQAITDIAVNGMTALAKKIAGGGIGAALENLKNTPFGAPTSAPLGMPSMNQASNNQNVNQQTTINVSGVADSERAGRVVAGEQGKVNMDLVRNMQGAILA